MADTAMLTAPHPRHDRLTIAAAADRTNGPLPALTQALLAACAECARLHADLVALAAALPSAATPRRTRDFTLSAADAERLRPRGLRHWLGLIGTSRDAITRPLAIGFTTLGLAGLLLATVPGSLSLSSGAAARTAPPVTESVTGPTDGGFTQVTGNSDVTAIPSPAPDTDQGPGPLVILSSGFVLAGGGLFVVRRRHRSVMR